MPIEQKGYLGGKGGYRDTGNLLTASSTAGCKGGGTNMPLGGVSIVLVSSMWSSVLSGDGDLRMRFWFSSSIRLRMRRRESFFLSTRRSRGSSEACRFRGPRGGMCAGESAGEQRLISRGARTCSGQGGAGGPAPARGEQRPDTILRGEWSFSRMAGSAPAAWLMGTPPANNTNLPLVTKIMVYLNKSSCYFLYNIVNIGSSILEVRKYSAPVCSNSFQTSYKIISKNKVSGISTSSQLFV